MKEELRTLLLRADAVTTLKTAGCCFAVTGILAMCRMSDSRTLGSQFTGSELLASVAFALIGVLLLIRACIIRFGRHTYFF